jgi:hypothetical protein
MEADLPLPSQLCHAGKKVNRHLTLRSGWNILVIFLVQH